MEQDIKSPFDIKQDIKCPSTYNKIKFLPVTPQNIKRN